jgi:hypothetical protein
MSREQDVFTDDFVLLKKIAVLGETALEGMGMSRC